MRHDDVINWLHFFALLALSAGNSPVTGEFPSQNQWCRALMFSLICAWINGWANNRESGDLRRHHVHNNVTAMDLFRFVYYVIVLRRFMMAIYSYWPGLYWNYGNDRIPSPSEVTLNNVGQSDLNTTKQLQWRHNDRHNSVSNHVTMTS